LAHSHDEYIQYLDVGDVLHPDKLVTRLAFAHQQSLDGQPERRAPHISDNDVAAGLLRDQTFIQLGAANFRRTWLETVDGLDVTCLHIQAVHLLLRLAMASGRFGLAPSDVLVSTYRQRTDSRLRQNDDPFIRACLGDAGMDEQSWGVRNESSATHMSILFAVYSKAARHFAGRDSQEFSSVERHIGSLDPRWLPLGLRRLRATSRLVGYRRAERMGSPYGRFKRTAIRSKS
jgi:hypothetical protein